MRFRSFEDSFLGEVRRQSSPHGLGFGDSVTFLQRLEGPVQFIGDEERVLLLAAHGPYHGPPSRNRQCMAIDVGLSIDE